MEIHVQTNPKVKPSVGEINIITYNKIQLNPEYQSRNTMANCGFQHSMNLFTVCPFILKEFSVFTGLISINMFQIPAALKPALQEFSYKNRFCG